MDLTCSIQICLKNLIIKYRSVFFNTDRFLHHYSKHQSGYQLILGVHFSIGNHFWYITMENTLHIEHYNLFFFLLQCVILVGAFTWHTYKMVSQLLRGEEGAKSPFADPAQ